MDKAAILSDAVRVVSQLRGEAEKLRESTENLQDKINELKVTYLVCTLNYAYGMMVNLTHDLFFFLCCMVCFYRLRKMSFVMRSRD